MRNGYKGYKWSKVKGPLSFHVFTAKVNGEYISHQEMEGVEAEVVYQCRNDSGQWPLSQNEIHFQKTTLEQRKLAVQIYNELARAD